MCEECEEQLEWRDELIVKAPIDDRKAAWGSYSKFDRLGVREAKRDMLALTLCKPGKARLSSDMGVTAALSSAKGRCF